MDGGRRKIWKICESVKAFQRWMCLSTKFSSLQLYNHVSKEILKKSRLRLRSVCLQRCPMAAKGQTQFGTLDISSKASGDWKTLWRDESWVQALTDQKGQFITGYKDGQQMQCNMLESLTAQWDVRDSRHDWYFGQFGLAFWKSKNFDLNKEMEVLNSWKGLKVLNLKVLVGRTGYNHL